MDIVSDIEGLDTSMHDNILLSPFATWEGLSDKPNNVFEISSSIIHIKVMTSWVNAAILKALYGRGFPNFPPSLHSLRASYLRLKTSCKH